MDRYGPTDVLSRITGTMSHSVLCGSMQKASLKRRLQDQISLSERQEARSAAEPIQKDDLANPEA